MRREESSKKTVKKAADGEKTCVVIGAGLAGLSAAYELSQKGWKVTVLRPETASAAASTGITSVRVRSCIASWAGSGSRRGRGFVRGIEPVFHRRRSDQVEDAGRHIPILKQAIYTTTSCCISLTCRLSPSRSLPVCAVL
jgi:hypothetical protein